MVAAAAVVAVAVVAATGLLGGDRPAQEDAADEQSEAGEGDGEGSSTVGDTVEIVAGDHDPFGGREHPEDVSHAFDGDPATVWQTQRYYRDPALGRLKPGVGIWFDLGSADAVDEIVVTTTNPGSDFTVYAGDTRPEPDAEPQQWGTAVASVSDAGRQERIRLDNDADGPVWMLWFTRLAPAEGRGYRATVADVRFLAP